MASPHNKHSNADRFPAYPYNPPYTRRKTPLPSPPRVNWHGIVFRAVMVLDGGLEVNLGSHQG